MRSVDLTQIPTLGAAAALVVVIGYLLVSNRADRSQQREDMDAALRRIKGLEADVVSLNSQLDHERELRRGAEDNAASALRQVAELRGELAVLRRS